MDFQREFAHLHRPAGFDGLELLTAHYHAHAFSPHVHEGYCIALIEQGAERFRYRGTEHCAVVGDIAIVNPDHAHTGQRATDEGWSYRVFYPDAQVLNGLAAEMGITGGGTLYFREAIVKDAELVVPLRELHRSLVEKASRLEQESRWRETFGGLLLRHANVARPGEWRGHELASVARAREMLQAQFAGNPGLADLAAEAGLSPWHLNRVFRREVGLPPHAYQNQLRLNRAKILLRGDLPLAQVAASVGFADQAHFTRQFKKAFGVTPGKYRAGCL